jgi:hypothetical protein
LHAIGLAQDLKRTSDIEQKQAWGDYDEHRDTTNFIRTRGTADKRFIIATEYSFPPWP